MPKPIPYDELPILPWVIADTVAAEVYRGRECSNLSDSFIAKVEAARLAMTPADRKTFREETEATCRAAYASPNDNFFKRCARSKSNRGRDQLYVWVRRWLAAFLAKRGGFMA